MKCPCGTDVHVPKYLEGRKKYCSKTCFYTYRPVTGFQKGHPAFAGTERTRFRKGDHTRDKHPMWRGGWVSHGGYILEGTVQQHRRVVSDVLRRPLLRREVVHHVNKVPNDNRVENLQLFRHQAAHARLHAFASRHGVGMECLRTNWEKMYAG